MKENYIGKSFLASLLISIGCITFLNCNNIYIGALLFSFGILSIIQFKLYLYTGIASEGWRAIIINDYAILKKIFKILLWNIISITIFGIIIGLFGPIEIVEKSYSLVINKIETNDMFFIIESILCGLMIFIAVAAKNRWYLTILSIMIFIVCGFEHSIANTFYYACALTKFLDLKIFLEVINLSIVCIVGNFLGAIIIPLSFAFNVVIKNNKS